MTGKISHAFMNEQIEKQVKAWSKGNDRVFRAIFDYFRPRLLAATLRNVAHKEVAEELVMNTLLKIWELRAKVEDIQHLEHYIFGIMRQQIAGHLRKKLANTISISDVPLEELGATALPELSYREILERYQTALQKLPPQRKKIFLMSREEALSNAEIARKTQLSIHTVNNHIKSSLKIIKNEFQDHPEAITFILAVTPAILS